MGAIKERKLHYNIGMGNTGQKKLPSSKKSFPAMDFHRLGWWTIWRRYSFLLDDEIDHRPDLRSVIEISALLSPPETDLKAFQNELNRQLYRLARDLGWHKTDGQRWERLEFLQDDLFWDQVQAS